MLKWQKICELQQQGWAPGVPTLWSCLGWATRRKPRKRTGTTRSLGEYSEYNESSSPEIMARNDVMTWIKGDTFLNWIFTPPPPSCGIVFLIFFWNEKGYWCWSYLKQIQASIKNHLFFIKIGLFDRYMIKRWWRPGKRKLWWKRGNL